MPGVKIYTRTGDRGETSLLSGGRVAKDHRRISAYGTLDELNSVIGVLLAEGVPDRAAVQLEQVQRVLFSLGRRWRMSKAAMPATVPIGTRRPSRAGSTAWNPSFRR